MSLWSRLQRPQSPPRDDRDTTETITRTGTDTMLVPAVEIVVTTNTKRVVSAHLPLRPLVIGKDAHCDIVVQDGSVSARHAEVHLTERGIMFRDLRSKNGSFLGGVRVFECVVPVGTSVAMGKSQLTLRVEPGAGREVPLWPKPKFGSAVGESLVMRALFADLVQVGAREGLVVLLGEHGTGRAELARSLHEVGSLAASRPWMEVDLSAEKKKQHAALLFGKAETSKTGKILIHPGCLERAREGTLFLGNVDELSIDVFGTLVEALRTRTVSVNASAPRTFDARVVVSATPIGERSAILQGLAHASGGACFTVPALRDRKEDIQPLVNLFVEQSRAKRGAVELPRFALPFFLSYDWPGNVRELRKLVTLFLGMENVARYLAEFTGDNFAPVNLSSVLDMGFYDARSTVMDHFDRAYIKAKLAENGGNVTRTAEKIGVPRTYLQQLKREHLLMGDDEDSD